MLLICTVAFLSGFGLLWTIGENEKKKKKCDALSNENALVLTGRKKY